MTTQEIADQLVSLCRMGQYDEAYATLFAKDATALEPAHTQQPEAKGLDALKQKAAYFASTVKEIHSNYVSDPVVAGNHFTCSMIIDMTNTEGNRSTMSELCVYETKDGKVVKEQFFY